MKLSIIVLILTASQFMKLFSEERPRLDWNVEFDRVAVGAKNDIQYTIYRDKIVIGKYYVNLLNRTVKDVKVEFSIVKKSYTERVKILNLVGFVKAGQYWPSSGLKTVQIDIPDFDIEFNSIINGKIKEEFAISVDQSGVQTETITYKFVDEHTAREKDKK